MRGVFLTVLNMSLTACFIILVVLLARLALKKAPKIFSYALWAVVLFRLLCPFTVPSPVSVVPSAQPIPPATVESPKFYVDSGIPAIDEPVNDWLGDHYFEGVALAPANAKADFFDAASVVWLTGVGGLSVYSLISLLLLRRRLIGAVPLEGEQGVWQADHIPSPFVLGLFRPRIYLPSDLPEEERDYVLLHERTHIRRGDHIFRALAWLAAAVHWFDPLVWLAFHLAGKDMEMSCDEAVLRKMGRDVRADYSASLLRMSVGERLPAGPLAFGGAGLKGRIKNVLDYKKPAFWAAALALILVLCTGAALATDPIDQTIIDPASVSSVSFSGRTFLNTEYVSPTARRDDLFDPDSPYARPLSEEDGMELVRLIDTYHKKVFYWGDPEGRGLDDWVLINCQDGGYYLLHYYYWSTLCFDLFHPGHGEDDYVTLVTRYDAQGTAGTTWRMECRFDDAFKDWRAGIARPSAPDGGETAAPGDELTFSIELGPDSAPLVRIDGSALERNAIWWTGGMEDLYDGHSQVLSMSCRFSSGGADTIAWWTDETHTAVTLSTKMSAMFSSYIPVGYWEFTVDLTGEPGTVTAMDAQNGEHTIDAPLKMCPKSITDEEAVEAARIAAKLLTAAEDFYRNAAA